MDIFENGEMEKIIGKYSQEFTIFSLSLNAFPFVTLFHHREFNQFVTSRIILIQQTKYNREIK